jgi:hypothetical protein
MASATDERPAAGVPMFSSKRYRAKAAEYGERGKASDVTSEILEYRGLARRLAEWADNEESAENRSKQRPRRQGGDRPADQAAEEDRILLCLGAAVVVDWDNLPKQVQSGLSTLAASMRERLQTTALRAQIARFLREREDDRREKQS